MMLLAICVCSVWHARPLRRGNITRMNLCLIACLHCLREGMVSQRRCDLANRGLSDPVLFCGDPWLVLPALSGAISVNAFTYMTQQATRLYKLLVLLSTVDLSSKHWGRSILNPCRLKQLSQSLK